MPFLIFLSCITYHPRVMSISGTHLETDDIQKTTIMPSSENIAVMFIFVESLFKEDKKYIRLTEINSRENCFEKPYCCSCIVLSLFYHDWINGLTVAAAVFMATTVPGFVPVTASVRVGGCVVDAVTAFPLWWK